MKPITLFTTTLSALNWVPIQMPAQIAVPPPAPVALNLFVAVLALLAGGCSHEYRHKTPAAAIGQEFQPRAPVFLTGPAVVLLTNSGGFTARLFMSSVPASHVRPVSGQLVARGSRFFFEPEQTSGKQARAGQFSFIWDATSNKGYILSEALQGYAPTASAVWFTNLVVQDLPTTTEKIEGYRVERATTMVAASDGSLSRFEVSRARDLDGLAIRIGSIEDPLPFTITLSQIRLELPPEESFLPPDGFTGYESEQAMMNELAARQQGAPRGGRQAATAGACWRRARPPFERRPGCRALNPPARRRQSSQPVASDLKSPTGWSGVRWLRSRQWPSRPFTWRTPIPAG